VLGGAPIYQRYLPPITPTGSLTRGGVLDPRSSLPCRSDRFVLRVVLGSHSGIPPAGPSVMFSCEASFPGPGGPIGIHSYWGGAWSHTIFVLAPFRYFFSFPFHSSDHPVYGHCPFCFAGRLPSGLLVCHPEHGRWDRPRRLWVLRLPRPALFFGFL